MRKHAGSLEVFFSIGSILLLIAGSIFISAYICKTKWQDSGFECRWALFTGCQIKTKEGRWIPAESYREVP